MSEVLRTIQQDLRSALKGGDRARVGALRFLVSQIQYARIAKQADLTDEDVLAVLAKQAKNRKESIEAFRQGGRQDLVDKESRELTLIEAYLPAQVGVDEIRERIRAVIAAEGLQGAADLGRLMKTVMAEFRGRADGSVISRIAREELEGAAS